MRNFNSTPWTNGKPNHRTGSGFGLRIPKDIRETLFQVDWKNIEISTGGKIFNVPITPGFWNKCNEIRSAEIGKWLIENGLDIWPKGHPPKIKVRYNGGRRFTIVTS